MSRPRMPKKYAIDDIKSRFQTVAIDNKYQAFFKPNGDIYDAASQIGLDARFVDEDLGLYVSDAVLPGSSFADIEIAGDRQGITERVPFSRIYDDVTFTFMVDENYKVMRFFESWMGLVNPLYGTTSASSSNQVMTLNYPKKYKCDMSIVKFNKDYDIQSIPNRSRGVILYYQFNEAWPFSVASTPVNYEGGSVLKLNVTFRYTRYFVYDVTTVGERFGRYGNSDSFNFQLGGKRNIRPSSTSSSSSSRGAAGDLSDSETRAINDMTGAGKHRKGFREPNRGFLGWRSFVDYLSTDFVGGAFNRDLDGMGD